MRQGDSKAGTREARLAAQLRDNLRRRKQQARAAAVAPAEQGSSGATLADVPNEGENETDG